MLSESAESEIQTEVRGHQEQGSGKKPDATESPSRGSNEAGEARRDSRRRKYFRWPKRCEFQFLSELKARQLQDMMEDKRKGFWSREPARVLDELAAAKARCPTNGQFGLRQDVQLRELKKPRGFEHLTEAQQKAELRNMERAARR